MQPFFLGGLTNKLNTGLTDWLQGDRHKFDFKLACLYFREIQNIVDDRKEMPSTLFDFP
ncbi:MAG: hypothetical protein R3E79_39295 [Caldilineaceae bacterium]